MDEDTKRQFDGIAELWKHCWQSIAGRRRNEWRAAYTLWTAFAALIVLTLRGELRAQTHYFHFVLVFGLVLCFIHGSFLVGIGKRHSRDREMAFHYEDILRDLSNSGFDEELKRGLKEERKKQKAGPWSKILFCDWSRRTQFLVTVVLFFLLALVVYLEIAP